MSTPQKSSPRKAASSLTLGLLAEEKATPSSPTIGGRSRRASLSGVPVSGVAASPAPSTNTPRRRSLAVRSSSAAKASDSVTSSPVRHVSKMKRLSESPERTKEEEKKEEEVTEETAEQQDEKVTEGKEGQVEKEAVKSLAADDKDSSPSEVGSVSGDSASGDAPRRTLRLRRQPITYK